MTVSRYIRNGADTANSGFPPEALVEVGDDHHLADSELLEAMLRRVSG